MTQPPPPGTLFPKISGKYADFIQNMKHFRINSADFPKDALEIPLIGTVKLHGAHNDIVIHADDTIQLQSRNMPNLGLENDSYSFAKTFLPLWPEILMLKEQIHARFREKNVSTEIEDEHPLIIAGEWIGPGIQKSVEINGLPNRLLIIVSICINGCWQPEEDYTEICCPEIGIHHISRGGIFRHSVHLGTNEEMESSLTTLQLLADAVEKECPFAKTFGLIGQGEGIVFKPTLRKLGEDAKFWLKVKGPISRGSGLYLPKLKKDGPGLKQMELAKKFAEAEVSEPRLEQGWDYLRETKVERTKNGVGAFLRWLNGDIEVEEKTEIEDLGVDKVLLNKYVVYLGKKWYFKRVEETRK